MSSRFLAGAAMAAMTSTPPFLPSSRAPRWTAPRHSRRTDQSVTCGYDHSPAGARRTPLPQRRQPAALARSTSRPTWAGAGRSSASRTRGRLLRARGPRRMGAVGRGHRHGDLLQLQPRPGRRARARRVGVGLARGGARGPAACRRRHAAAAARRGDASPPTRWPRRRELALRATEACTRHARPLYAAHADLPVPERAAPGALARRHPAARTPRRRPPRRAARPPVWTRWRRWSATPRPARAWRPNGSSPPAAGAAATGRPPCGRLRERGLLDARGRADRGRGRRCARRWRTATDRMDRAPYEHLGAEGVERLTELAARLPVRRRASRRRAVPGRGDRALIRAAGSGARRIAVRRAPGVFPEVGAPSAPAPAAECRPG